MESPINSEFSPPRLLGFDSFHRPIRETDNSITLHNSGTVYFHRGNDKVLGQNAYYKYEYRVDGAPDSFFRDHLNVRVGNQINEGVPTPTENKVIEGLQLVREEGKAPIVKTALLDEEGKPDTYWQYELDDGETKHVYGDTYIVRTGKEVRVCYATVQLPEGLPPIEFPKKKKLDTEADTFEFLRQMYPWLELSDIFEGDELRLIPEIGNLEAEIARKGCSPTEYIRIKAYSGLLEIDADSLTPGERVFLAAINHFRFMELVYKILPADEKDIFLSEPEFRRGTTYTVMEMHEAKVVSALHAWGKLASEFAENNISRRLSGPERTSMKEDILTHFINNIPKSHRWMYTNEMPTNGTGVHFDGHLGMNIELVGIGCEGDLEKLTKATTQVEVHEVAHLGDRERRLKWDIPKVAVKEDRDELRFEEFLAETRALISICFSRNPQASFDDLLALAANPDYVSSYSGSVNEILKFAKRKGIKFELFLKSFIYSSGSGLVWARQVENPNVKGISQDAQGVHDDILGYKIPILDLLTREANYDHSIYDWLRVNLCDYSFTKARREHADRIREKKQTKASTRGPHLDNEPILNDISIKVRALVEGKHD